MSSHLLDRMRPFGPQIQKLEDQRGTHENKLADLQDEIAKLRALSDDSTALGQRGWRTKHFPAIKTKEGMVQTTLDGIKRLDASIAEAKQLLLKHPDPEPKVSLTGHELLPFPLTCCRPPRRR